MAELCLHYQSCTLIKLCSAISELADKSYCENPHHLSLEMKEKLARIYECGYRFDDWKGTDE